MKITRPVGAATAFGVATAALVVVAAALVARRPNPARIVRSIEFQVVVGGLGTGPALDLATCVPDFDPRVGAVCRGATDPVPGGRAFCAHRGGSALFDAR
jgi:hypothetical protein